MTMVLDNPSRSAAQTGALDVFYDGECPVCRLEVGYYRRIDASGVINWIDITRLDDEALPAGNTRDDLLGRFHVRDAGGQWHIGVDAFARIWHALPGWRHLAFVFSVPGLRQMAELGYRGFLSWQKRHRARRTH